MREEVQDTLKYSYWIEDEDKELQTLSLNHLALSFFICVSGIGLSVIAFAIENIHHKVRKHKTEHSEDKAVTRGKEDGNNKDEKDIMTVLEM